MDWLHYWPRFFTHFVSVSFATWHCTPFTTDLESISPPSFWAQSCDWLSWMECSQRLEKAHNVFLQSVLIVCPPPTAASMRIAGGRHMKGGSGGPSHLRGDILECSCQPSPAGTDQHTCELSKDCFESLCFGVVCAALVLWQVMDAVINN